MSFYDFSAKHWTHICTTNPINSTFATVRHRTKPAKDCLSFKTTELIVFKMIREAENHWLKLRGQNQLPKLITSVESRHGIESNILDKQTVV